jgi:hypothetical protein
MAVTCTGYSKKVTTIPGLPYTRRDASLELGQYLRILKRRWDFDWRIIKGERRSVSWVRDIATGVGIVPTRYEMFGEKWYHPYCLYAHILSFCLLCLFSSALYQRKVVNVKATNLATSVNCPHSSTSARLTHSHHLLHSSQPPNWIILSPQSVCLKHPKILLSLWRI